MSNVLLTVLLGAMQSDSTPMLCLFFFNICRELFSSYTIFWWWCLCCQLECVDDHLYCFGLGKDFTGLEHLMPVRCSNSV
ncbi:hypothetical protein POTOM_029342 [Populus tomentosa]|uniref:Uncharacterized protein n=1 Tax=Populus tomentosa TaxID=118781 RepID=A0A8X7Z9V1_POPTO|nr:hypothetical protein POTOM_029342 [Populus tomentosa]